MYYRCASEAALPLVSEGDGFFRSPKPLVSILSFLSLPVEAEVSMVTKMESPGTSTTTTRT